jgi:hypothetical protein
MATLTGTTITTTYDSLLHVEDNTAGLVATSTDSRVIQDGVGANSALALATDSVRITSTNKLYFNDVGGEYISGNGSILNIAGGSEIDLTATAIDINGTADISGTLTIGGNIDFNSGTIDLSTQTVDVTLNAAVDALNFDSNTLSIDASNNRIGIGTAAPSGTLHIKYAGAGDTVPGLLLESTESGTATAPDLMLYRNSASPAVDDYLASIAMVGRNDNNQDVDYCDIYGRIMDETDGTEDGAMFFRTVVNGSQNDTMIIRSGFVGIGETTPVFPLHVKGRDDASSPNYIAMFDNLSADSDSHGIQIQAGDTNHSDSDTHYIVFKESDGGAVGELDSDSGTLALSDASDERLKKNIVDTATKGLEIINGARMRDFNWKKNDLPIKCGIIAQELQSVFPKAVKEGDDEDKTLRIRKTDFIYVLVKAVQELSASNDALKARIEVLEAA